MWSGACEGLFPEHDVQGGQGSRRGGQGVSLGSREGRLQEKGKCEGDQGGMKQGIAQGGHMACILGDNNLSKNWKQERGRPKSAL